MPRGHCELTSAALEATVERLGGTDSLITEDRICLGCSHGFTPDVAGCPNLDVLLAKSYMPWFLWPLRFIVCGNRTVVEVKQAQGVAEFVKEADTCFCVEFLSFRRTLLPDVVRQVSRRSYRTDLEKVIEHDATRFVFGLCCDGGKHESWVVWTAYGSDAPQDLVDFSESVTT